MCLYEQMRKTIYILDGYNLIHRVPRWREKFDISLEQGRNALLGYCRRWVQTRGDVWLFYVVFDGDSAVMASHSSAGPGIRVVYSRTGETADDRILEIVHEFGEKCRYVVVSDDNYVARNARGLDAETMAADTFAAVLNAKSSKTCSKRRGISQNDFGENDKPDGQTAKSITESLMREWNV
jgi:predicted RNA-binding protein with PIN domain